MREAGRHVAEILLALRQMAEPGVKTLEFDRLAAKEIDRRGLTSSFVGYSPGGLPPYPASVCVSVNEEVVHGIPGSRELRKGDILSLDFGIICDGFHGDSAVTIPVGESSAEAGRLIEATRDSLYQGIAEMVPGRRLSDIGHAIQHRAEGGGFSVVRQFVGHGIGRQLHEPPQVPNYGRAGRGPRLLPGMVFAIEPMVNVGTENVRMLDDEWTAVTADGQLSAHFEHTVLVTEETPEVLTRIAESH
ncbi:MAG: type I methionyl aminopeptidase [Deltaproteobacteria bacterium]|nr:type I methionyl aminopeptidase [Deltaproteobacteria bacterium]MBW2421513.1 type I methionyl aminopeptidase [Deltaproteobacteria bacterium]